MALPVTIYRATIQLSHVDRNIYATLPVTVARHPSETAERLVARLLAYALWYEPDLTFTKGISAGDEPDLWSLGPDNRVALWLEIGLPDPERLVKASRHAGRTALFACGSNLARWQAQHLAKLAAIANLTLLTVDQSFLDQLVSRLERTLSWDVTVTEGTIYLEVAGTVLSTTLQHLSGPPLNGGLPLEFCP
ncbi:MAG TPA: YaeQ family protein [Geobacteraceae bacterium]